MEVRDVWKCVERGIRLCMLKCSIRLGSQYGRKTNFKADFIDLAKYIDETHLWNIELK